MKIEERDGLESRADITPLAAAVYPPETLATIVWRNVVSAGADRRIMVYDGDRLVSSAGVLFRWVTLDGVAVEIAGIGGVMTLPSVQRKGFGNAAMEAAHDIIFRRKTTAFGLLFCEPTNFGFYQSLDWTAFNGTVIAEQPGATGPYRVMPALVRSFRRVASINGVIDLGGLPW